MVQNLEGTRAVVTGGNRGLGLGIVQALVAAGARVTVVARHGARLDELHCLDVPVWPGDATDPAVMDAVVAHVDPVLLILNAGAAPVMASLVDQTWDTFSATWNVDVKAGLHGIQAAFRAPLATGSRVNGSSSRRSSQQSRRRGHPAVTGLCDTRRVFLHGRSQ